MATSAETASDDFDLYQLLVESVADYAIFALDPVGNVASWNKGAERLKGYSAEEIIGRHFSVFYTEDDKIARKPQRELAAAEAQGRVEDEGWRLRKDGSRFWANVVITALRDADGDLVGFAKVTKDLTARRVAEQQARQLAAEAAARTAAEQGNEELRTINDQLQQETLRAEAQTQHAQELAQELEQTNDHLAQTLAEVEESRDAVQTAEQQMRFLVRAGDAMAATLDYETNLRTLARMVVPQLADWCIVEMSDGDGQLQAVAVAHSNPAKVELAHQLRRRYPVNPQSSTGAAHVVRTGEPELYEKITEDMLAAEVHDEAHRAILRDLDLRSVMILPLRARGRTMGTFTLVAAESGRQFGRADLTFAMELARRAALSVDNARLHAEALAARKAAERAADVKTRFLAVMSHEPRTPLNAIGGYAELLSMGLRGPVTPEQKQDLARIARNQVGLQALINDILDYAKLESGGMALKIQYVNVRHEVEELEALVAPQLQAKKLTYDYHGCAPDVSVCADPRSLRQILLNLLSNAIKFTAPEGRIRLSCATNSDNLLIKVSDSGIGIPPDQLESVFEPFVQLNRDSSHPKEGTGLGLSISRDLARAMRGELLAESQVGTGSTFSVVLPLAADADHCESVSDSAFPSMKRNKADRL
jgi:PAS domain S-box-containing protein